MLGYLLLAERLISYITAQVKSKLSLTPICTDTSTSYGKELDFGLVLPGSYCSYSIETGQIGWQHLYLQLNAFVCLIYLIKASSIRKFSIVTIRVHRLSG